VFFRYGQTNCFIGTGITYSIVAGKDPDSVYIVTMRAARNMAYQGLLRTDDKVEKLGEVKGIDLVGTKIHAPLSVHQEVYLLPMDNVLATKVS
jgi:leucyl-tRNA synthetase